MADKEIADLENGSPTTDATTVNGLRVATTTATTSDNDNHDKDEDEEIYHDQLPTLEEYKTSLAARGEVLSPRLSESALNIIFDPEGMDDDEDDEYKNEDEENNNNDNNNDDDDDDDDNPETRIHDQLPSPEEIKANNNTGSSYFHCLNCLIISAGVVLVVLAVILPFLLFSKARLLPTKSRRDQAIALMEQLGVSSPNDMITFGTPQYRAILWITEEDTAHLKIPNTSTSATRGSLVDSKFVERYVLAVFYFALNGPEWKHQLNFLSGRDVCEWAKPTATPSGTPLTLGVTKCVDVSLGDGQEGEATEQFVSGLYLYSNNLQGSIPREIQYLGWLEKFNLPVNEGLTGELPQALRELGFLKDLELQYCSLTGSIPEWIGDMVLLTDLALSNNLLHGRVPTTIAKLSALELLTLDDNMLEGDIAVFGKLGNLNALYAEDSGLYGQLSEEMIETWSSMRDLDLSGNSIGGSLPDNIFQMPNLVILDLNGNDISGSLPAVPTNNTQLRFVSLFENAMDGSIPPSISKLQRLQHLDLGKNRFTSTFPTEMASMIQLKYLHTNYNDFDQQQLPTFLEHLSNLKELSMNNNNLIGSIPTFINAMTSLNLFDLGSNQLGGSIPEAIGHLQGLNFLLLNRNQLTGRLPDSIALLYNLKLVLIDGNQINGSASVLCGHYINSSTSYFSSDCLGNNPQIECTCCNVCCNEDTESSCNHFDWSSNLDPLWEYTFQRVKHEFDGRPLPPDAAANGEP